MLTHTQIVEVQSELPLSVSAVFEQLDGQCRTLLYDYTHPPAM